jgi:hypothetical protein
MVDDRPAGNSYFHSLLSGKLWHLPFQASGRSAPWNCLDQKRRAGCRKKLKTGVSLNQERFIY